MMPSEQMTELNMHRSQSVMLPPSGHLHYHHHHHSPLLNPNHLAPAAHHFEQFDVHFVDQEVVDHHPNDDDDDVGVEQ